MRIAGGVQAGDAFGNAGVPGKACALAVLNCAARRRQQLRIVEQLEVGLQDIAQRRRRGVRALGDAHADRGQCALEGGIFGFDTRAAIANFDLVVIKSCSRPQRETAVCNHPAHPPGLGGGRQLCGRHTHARR